MKHLILSIVFAFGAGIFAQNAVTEKRVEFDLKDGFSNERVFEFGPKGMLIFSKQDKDENQISTYRFEKYNTDLVSTHEVSYTIENKFYVDEIYQTGNYVYFFFKTRRTEYRVVKYDFTNETFKEVSGELPNRSFIKYTACMDDRAVMAIINKNYSISIISIDMNSGSEQTTPITIEGFKPKKLSLSNMETMPESKNILLSINAYISKKRTELYVMRLDEQGQVQATTDISIGTDNNLRNARAYDIGNNEYILSGTYSVPNSGGSNGFFISRLAQGQLEPIKFYNFTELKNFLSYLPANQQRKIEKKKQRKANNGQELNISYNIAAHSPIKVNEDFIYIGEAYYATYRTETRTTTSYVNGKPVTTTTYVQVFDGYQYTHAFIAKFDKNGNLIWDQTFPMWLAQKPMTVRRFIHVADQQQNNLKLVYANSNRITSKVFDFDGNVLSDKQSEPIETNSENDKTRLSYAEIIHWYDNYFLSYGIQRIINRKDKDIERKRTVFFFNKIKLD
ncbi:MAG: hypothetical protein RL737_1066 [Bacteroidota bacterium]|jgi:hypothetical protein